MKMLLVAAGGAVGSMARYGLGAWVLARTETWSFPIGTFIVNVLGCLIAGVLIGVAEYRNFLTPDLRLLIFTGFLGGFTTFSAFGVETVALIEEACDALVQLSTGVGLDVPFEARERLVEARPRMASLNPCSMSFANGEFRNPPEGVRRLAARMQELGVKPELEIYDTGHLEVALQLAEEGLVPEPLQFSIVMGIQGGMPATPTALVQLVDRLPPGAVWQAIAIGRWNLPMTAIGLAMGGNVRTGMEDTLMLRRGVPAESNAQLVERLAGVARSLEREPAAVGEVEQRLQLPARPPVPAAG